MRILMMKKQRKVSDEKIRFFINTAHDIRTPLTLIKAPLEEVEEREQLSEKEKQPEHRFAECECLIASDYQPAQF